MNKQYYVYVITNEAVSTFYIGVTNNLIRRVFEHKDEVIDGFSKKYKLHKLVYYETVLGPLEAIEREKQLKRWHRNWKINLIKSVNPNFDDLYENLIK